MASAWHTANSQFVEIAIKAPEDRSLATGKGGGEGSSTWYERGWKMDNMLSNSVVIEFTSYSCIQPQLGEEGI